MANKHRVTEPDKSGQLTTKKKNAIELLITGKTDAEVAKAVGVTRQTVNQWRNHDATFVAELNYQRETLWQAERERLRSLVRKAVNALDANLDSDNEGIRQRAALHVLKCVGLYGKDATPSGPTTAEEITRQWEDAEVLADLIRSLGSN